jgi:hypothetical protein
MTCKYFYDNILENYLYDVRVKILINNNYEDKPFPIYETREDYDSDTESNFKGLLVWEAQRYYAGLENNENNDVYDNTIDFYVVPEIGNVKIVRNYEYSQLISYTFDTNTSQDKDPTTLYQIKFINWFVNKHKELFEDEPYTLVNDINLKAWVQTIQISKPIYVPNNTIYVRRVVLVQLKYCNC